MTPLARFILAIASYSLFLCPTLAEERDWTYPLSLVFNEVEVQILNWEVTRDRKALLLHARLRCVAKEAIYFPWKDLVVVENSKGQSYSPNYDALVDRNGAGLTRTFGEFKLAPREKARITIPFNLSDNEFPLRLRLPDGRLSILIP